MSLVELPSDILELITVKLGIARLPTVSLVCKYFSKVASDPLVHYQIFQEYKATRKLPISLAVKEAANLSLFKMELVRRTREALTTGNYQKFNSLSKYKLRSIFLDLENLGTNPFHWCATGGSVECMKKLIELCNQQGEDVPNLLLKRSLDGTTPITIVIASDNSSMFQLMSPYFDMKKNCFQILFTYKNYPHFDVLNKFFLVHCIPKLIEEGDRSIGHFVGNSMNVDNKLSTTLVKYLLNNVKIKDLVVFWNSVYLYWSTYNPQNEELIIYVHNLKDYPIPSSCIESLLLYVSAHYLSADILNGMLSHFEIHGLGQIPTAAIFEVARRNPTVLLTMKERFPDFNIDNYVDQITGDTVGHAIFGSYGSMHNVNQDVILKLLGDDLKKVNFSGQTYLHKLGNKQSFFRSNYLDILQRLSEQINIDATDNEGKTALFYSIQTIGSNITVDLLKLHADVNKADNNGNTPLHCLVECIRSFSEQEFFSKLKLLKDAGCKFSAKNNNGMTAYDIWESQGKFCPNPSYGRCEPRPPKKPESHYVSALKNEPLAKKDKDQEKMEEEEEEDYSGYQLFD
eukprot:TRINITY_DN1386_c1_g1_i2.p1 TRINITY_DN1386_c1_g1~~TRINITY_DN1386_c1_g1_i2.p1  ORF type:complete len:571 (+),score=59.22 TRINITY_DN1386_c1_g1_i2:59-1771(+)